jgi:hypothetical protein
VFLYGLAGAFLLEAFIRRTWLTEQGIFQLKVHAMEGKPEALIEVA